jgi:hypothetical protein
MVCLYPVINRRTLSANTRFTDLEIRVSKRLFYVNSSFGAESEELFQKVDSLINAGLTRKQRYE